MESRQKHLGTWTLDIVARDRTGGIGVGSGSSKAGYVGQYYAATLGVGMMIPQASSSMSTGAAPQARPPLTQAQQYFQWYTNATKNRTLPAHTMGQKVRLFASNKLKTFASFGSTVAKNAINMVKSGDGGVQSVTNTVIKRVADQQPKPAFATLTRYTRAAQAPVPGFKVVGDKTGILTTFFDPDLAEKGTMKEVKRGVSLIRNQPLGAAAGSFNRRNVRSRGFVAFPSKASLGALAGKARSFAGRGGQALSKLGAYTKMSSLGKGGSLLSRAGAVGVTMLAFELTLLNVGQAFNAMDSGYTLSEAHKMQYDDAAGYYEKMANIMADTQYGAREMDPGFKTTFGQRFSTGIATSILGREGAKNTRRVFQNTLDALNPLKSDRGASIANRNFAAEAEKMRAKELMETARWITETGIPSRGLWATRGAVQSQSAWDMGATKNAQVEEVRRNVDKLKRLEASVI